MKQIAEAVPGLQARWMVILCCLICYRLEAIDRDRRIDQLYHTAWTAKDGAPTFASTWAQTPDGFLWFGNTTGLYRFDGAKFEPYEILSGAPLPKAGVYSLFATLDGSLLVGWVSGGVSLLKDGQFQDYGGPGSGFPKDAVVVKFQRGGDGSIWALLGARGIFRVDDGRHWLRVGANLPIPGDYTAFCADQKGTLWFSAAKKIFFLRSGEKKFHEFTGDGTSMAQSPDGTLWLGSHNTIRSISYDGIGSEIWTPPVKDDGEVLFADAAGSLWFKQDGKGILRIPHPENKSSGHPLKPEIFSTQQGLSNDVVSEIFQDREGNIWVMTPAGLDSFRQSNVVPVRLPTSAAYAFLDSSADEVRLTTVFPHAVMTIRDGSVSAVRPWDFKTLYVYHAKDGITWLGTEDQGLVKITKDQAQLVDTPGQGVHEITEDARGRLWADVRGKGLFRLENHKWTSFSELGGPPQRAKSSLTDSSGRTWFGLADNHVAMLNQEKITVFTSNEGVGVRSVVNIQEAAGTIFIGGDEGLDLFSGRRFVPVIPNNRKSFEKVWALLGSNESGLWFAEAQGIVHIALSEIAAIKTDPQHRVSYDVFDFHDGLPSNPQRYVYSPPSIESPDGRVWFALESGIVWIDPKRIVHNSIAPGVFVDSVSTNGRTYSLPLSKVILPARTTSARIDFTATNMTIPERVRFRYQLEGVDKEPQDPGTRREAFYTNLGPGSYRFRVIASNNDGVWNKTGAVATFTIAPTFYQTGWFKASWVLIACLVAAGGYRFRVRQIANAMHARFNDRLIERTRLARDLHDTLLQSFQALMLHLQVVNELLPYGERAKAELEKSLAHADRAIAEGRSAVYDLRSSAIATSDLPESIKALGKELSEEGAGTFRLVVEGPPRKLQTMIRDELYCITREALRNAFHHAQARHIEAEITYGGRSFVLRIRDDGSGIPPEILEQGRPGHYGVPGMRERAKQIGGKLEIWSGVGTGTEIEVSIAASIAYGTSPGWSLFHISWRKRGDK